MVGPGTETALPMQLLLILVELMDFPACIVVLSTLNMDCWFYWFIALSFPCCTSIIVSELCNTTRVTTVFTSRCSSLGKK